MINNPRPIVMITLGLVGLGILLGLLSGIPQIANLFFTDIHIEKNIAITATQRNLEATNDVVKSTQDYHSWVVTSSAMPLQQTSSGQNAQLAIVDMQNAATQAAFQNNLQGTKSAEQFVTNQTAFANYGQSTVEARKIMLTEQAMQLIADKDKYNFQLTQTQAAANFQIAQTQVVAAQLTDAQIKDEQAKKEYQQNLLLFGIGIIVAVPILLSIGVFLWAFVTFVKRMVEK